jgi:DNA recombination protein RmuC
MFALFFGYNIHPMINMTLLQLISYLTIFVLGYLFYWMISRSKTKLIIENEQNKLKTQLKLSQQQLEKLKELFLKSHQNNKKLEHFIEQLQNTNKELTIDLAVAEQQQLNGEEKIDLLMSNKEALSNQFKNLANEIFEEKDKKFSSQNKQKLDALLNPFSQQLNEFRTKVDSIYHDEGKQRASLLSEVRQLKELNVKLNQEAINLTKALTGDKKIQGAWGEMVLERVLEQSGLRKGYEYATQEGYRDNDNSLYKPDVIVHLPHSKDIVIDSKVSLIAYEGYCKATSKDQEKLTIQAHITAIKNHIKTLSEKDYSSLKGVNSLDFVLLFIPIEAAFVAAYTHDEKLLAQAFDEKIIIVTPTTLLATLKTIENLWRYEKQNQNAQDIAQRAGVLYDKFRGFVEDVEKLGKQLDTTQSTYHDAINKLSQGKGNLINQAQQLKALGVKVKKEIPKTILEQSDLEDN